MTTKTKAILLLLTGSIGLLVTIGLLAGRDQSLTRVQTAGRIKIGYAVEAPFVFLKPGGEVTGAEAEVAKVMVQRLGIQHIEWRLIEFGDLIPELEAGRIDAIVAGMFITPDRARHVSFSEPTFHVQQGLLVAASNPHQLQAYAQIATRPAIKIAVISGAIEGTLLKQLGVGPAQLVDVPDALTGRVAVETGAVDGLALSALTIRWLARQDQLGRTAMVQPFEQAATAQQPYLGYGAVVFRPGDAQLRSAWNGVLKDLIETPEQLSLIAPFGLSAADLPGAVTTQEILAQP